MSNLDFWNKVSKTNSANVKDSMQGLSSIDSYAMFKAATEAFGMCGIGWGYEILQEDFHVGGPVIKQDKNLGNEIDHILKIRFWYKSGDQIGELFHYGITRYVYGSKCGLITDEEAPKKSLTDAIKKCLSMLGFSADVYMGKFEDANYKAGNELRSKIEDSEESNQEYLNAIKETEDYLETQMKSIETIKSDVAFTAAMRKLYESVTTKCKAAGLDPSQMQKTIVDTKNLRLNKDGEQHES